MIARMVGDFTCLWRQPRLALKWLWFVWIGELLEWNVWIGTDKGAIPHKAAKIRVFRSGISRYVLACDLAGHDILDQHLLLLIHVLLLLELTEDFMVAIASLLCAIILWDHWGLRRIHWLKIFDLSKLFRHFRALVTSNSTAVALLKQWDRLMLHWLLSKVIVRVDSFLLGGVRDRHATVNTWTTKRVCTQVAVHVLQAIIVAICFQWAKPLQKRLLIGIRAVTSFSTNPRQDWLTMNQLWVIHLICVEEAVLFADTTE